MKSSALTLPRSTVSMASGASLSYDYLVLATGATHSYFGNDQWEPLAPGLKSIEDAIEIRRRVLLAFELAERQMLEQGWHPPLNFVVIGGGPTGVELAGAISDIAQLYMRHDFRHIDPAKSRVLLLDGGPRVLAAYPEDLSAKAEATLQRLGVEVHTKTQVTAVGPGWVEANGQRIDAAVTLWAAGVHASPLGKMLAAQPAADSAVKPKVNLDRRGCVIVDDNLNPPGLPEVFVLGDLAHFEQDGHQVPGVAQPAMQMGDHVAKMISADLAGKPRPAFRYFDKGDMATIGRMAAVAKVEWPFKAHMSGFPAWFTWLTVHIFFLIGFRNRLSVLAELGLDLLHLHARRSPHHWRPDSARLAEQAPFGVRTVSASGVTETLIGIRPSHSPSASQCTSPAFSGLHANSQTLTSSRNELTRLRPSQPVRNQRGSAIKPGGRSNESRRLCLSIASPRSTNPVNIPPRQSTRAAIALTTSSVRTVPSSSVYSTTKREFLRVAKIRAACSA